MFGKAGVGILGRRGSEEYCKNTFQARGRINGSMRSFVNPEFATDNWGSSIQSTSRRPWIRGVFFQTAIISNAGDKGANGTPTPLDGPFSTSIRELVSRGRFRRCGEIKGQRSDFSIAVLQDPRTQVITEARLQLSYSYIDLWGGCEECEVAGRPQPYDRMTLE
ncbi:hypothetical protein FA13DRAFT_1716570 [Coprinellus micaceus]|uniref:Uncharacterized protein n=1 Tax=Coprinellus micaceus TaxID=71717 RepID=A0A4Y7SIV8_COPMI|nr:hypothetical protein FA13DRAFT_1716570 [Coprinellus micaceus]